MNIIRAMEPANANGAIGSTVYKTVATTPATLPPTASAFRQYVCKDKNTCGSQGEEEAQLSSHFEAVDINGAHQDLRHDCHCQHGTHHPNVCDDPKYDDEAQVVGL